MANPLLEIDSAVAGFASVVADSSASLAGALVVPVTLGLTAYILWIGFLVIFGRLDAPLPTVTLRALKIALIVYLALGAAVYMSLVYGAIQGAEQLLVGAFSNRSTTIPATLFDSMSDIWNLIELKTEERRLQDGGGNFLSSAMQSLVIDFDLLIFKVFLTLGQVVMVVAAFLPYIIAKITLMLLGALGPLFVVLLIWPATQRFFDSWLTSVVAALLTFALIAALVGFTVPLANSIINSPANVAYPIDSLVWLILPVQLIFAWMLWNSSSIAGQLAGGGGSGNPLTTLVSTLIHHSLGKAFRRGPKGASESGGAMKGRANTPPRSDEGGNSPSGR